MHRSRFLILKQAGFFLNDLPHDFSDFLPQTS